MKVGVIGGSGLYNLPGITNVNEEKITTPFGEASDLFISGTLHDIPVVFLPRHGKGHRITPTEIPFRANIWGMKKLGVTHLISVSAVGSLKEEIVPGHIVLPDQFIDRTRQRVSTFFGNGIVGHVQFGDPVCQNLLKYVAKASKTVGASFHQGGTYICMEGPAFSTRAESNLYRSWGASVIGMTNIQEAKLAREAEMCFSTIALATDYDCWHQSEEEVTVDQILQVMHNNIETSKKILSETLKILPAERPCSCGSALKYGIVTSAEMIPEKVLSDLEIIVGKYLSK
ncbi:MAG: S-methyl-5'-thioadenosine phosphorylase [SAR324 cluster bacterium]|nr:S-methyl-5'-thioadenosine phosphorylase [SAR324 cluster bacterium]